jgi:hypothetical protein
MGRLPKEVDMFGRKSARGVLVITLVLNGHAACRAPLFLSSRPADMRN